MKVSWLIEKRVILVKANKRLELTDFVQVNRDIIAYLDDGGASTHIIADFRHVKTLPSTLNSFHKILTFMQHPNLHWEVFITSVGFIEFLAKTLTRTMGREKIEFVKTYEEAKNILQKEDPTLPDLPHSID